MRSHSLQHSVKAMSVFATSHCRLAFPIFPASTGCSVPGSVVRRAKYVHRPPVAERRPLSLCAEHISYQPTLQQVLEKPPGGHHIGSDARPRQGVRCMNTGLLGWSALFVFVMWERKHLLTKFSSGRPRGALRQARKRVAV